MTPIQSAWLGMRLRFLWLKHTYPYRWAHRPLCSRFRRDILKVGPIHLCRSCLCVYAGLLVSGAALACFPMIRNSAIPLLLCLGVPTLILSAPLLYAKFSRHVRDVLRFSTGCCIPLCICTGLTGHVAASALCAVILFLFWRIYFTLRRNRKAAACTGCVEIGEPGICSGCSRQADGIRAYETEATALLLSARGVPVPIPATKKYGCRNPGNLATPAALRDLSEHRVPSLPPFLPDE